MVDFKQWSLNQVQIKILRYFGGFVDGVFVRTLTQTIDTYASAQPYKTIDPDQLMRPEMGENLEKRIILFLNERLFLNNEADSTLEEFGLVPPSLTPSYYNLLLLNGGGYGGDGPSPTQEINDLVIIDGQPWKPISINNWSFDNISHYRSVLRLFDGF